MSERYLTACCQGHWVTVDRREMVCNLRMYSCTHC